jgi:Bacterial lipocalin
MEFAANLSLDFFICVVDMLKKCLLYCSVIFFFSSCSAAYVAFDSVEEFDISKYAGKWYELYRLPNKLEEGLEEIVIYYQVNRNGNIMIINEGRLIQDKNKVRQTKGRVWIPNLSEPSKLKVSFYWYKSDDHWVFHVDEGYTHALVGDPNGRHLWLLSRERDPDMRTVALMFEYAASLGFPVENLIRSLAY